MWQLIWLAFSVVVAVAVPFFSDMQQLLGALIGAPVVFGLPSFFYLQARRHPAENGRLGGAAARPHSMKRGRLLAPGCSPLSGGAMKR